MDNNSVQTTSGKTNILALIAVISGGLALLSALVSLVLALIIAIPGFICASVGGLFALAAIITGIIGLVQVNRPENTDQGKGLAIAGIAMGALGLIIACVMPLISAVVFGMSGMRMHIPRYWRMH